MPADSVAPDADKVAPCDPELPAQGLDDLGEDELFESREEQRPDRLSASHLRQNLRRVSNRLNEKEDWNVMRDQPPLSRLWLVALFPLIFLRVILLLLDLLQVVVFWNLARLYTGCCSCFCLSRRKQPVNPGETCFLSILIRLFLPLGCIFTRVRMHPSTNGEKFSRLAMRSAPFILANHLCYSDGLALAAHIPGRCKFVAKAGVAQIPLLGSLFTHMDTVYVDRGSKESRRRVIQLLEEHADSFVEGESKPLAVFPEGTTSNGKTVIPFKKGIFVAGKPVRPILVHYRNGLQACCPKRNRWKAGHSAFVSLRSSARAKAAGWTSGKAMSNSGDSEEAIVRYTDLAWLAGFLARPFVTCYVTVYPIYVPAEEEVADAETYAENVHAYMKKEYAELLQEFGDEEGIATE